MYQIFYRFNSKTYTYDMEDNKSIKQLKWDICQKFNLPYEICDMCEILKTPFYLTVGKNILDKRYLTIKDFNDEHPKNLIEKETTIHVRINVHSKLFTVKYPNIHPYSTL